MKNLDSIYFIIKDEKYNKYLNLDEYGYGIWYDDLTFATILTDIEYDIYFDCDNPSLVKYYISFTRENINEKK